MGDFDKVLKPDFLPDIFWTVFIHMRQCQKLNSKKASFFIDSRMEDFWKKVGGSDIRLDYAETFAGSVFNSLGIFDQVGTRQSPSTKTVILDNQTKANRLIKRISKTSANLRNDVESLLSLQAVWPEELYLYKLIENFGLESDLAIDSLPSGSSYFKINFLDLLSQLEIAINQQPNHMSDLYPLMPELHSAKSSKLDYLRSVYGLLDQLCINPCWREMGIRETEWVSFYRVMVQDDDAARDAVKKVLKEINYKKSNTR